MEQAAGKIFNWCDDKMFTVEAETDKQNYRVFARSSRDLLANVGGHFKYQKPACVVVWTAVSSNGRYKSPLVFIDEGVKVNSQVNLYMSQEKLPSRLTETFDKNHILEQVGVPIHTANVT